MASLTKVPSLKSARAFALFLTHSFSGFLEFGWTVSVLSGRILMKTHKPTEELLCLKMEPRAQALRIRLESNINFCRPRGKDEKA